MIDSSQFLKHVALLFLITVSLPFAQDPNFHVYLAFGQSNMAGAGSIESQDREVSSRFKMMAPMDCGSRGHTFGEWYPAIPPLWGGCNGGIGPGDYFGRTLAEELPDSIKVGIIVVAIPGCDIALFNDEGFDGYDTYNYVPGKYNGSAYAWILEMAKKAQDTGVIKGILLHQGESNNGDRDWPEKVKRVYNQYIRDLELEAEKTPLLVGELLYENQGGTTGGHNSIIADVPDIIPNSYVISAEGLTGKDQFHFDSEGNREFGRRYAAQMLEIIEAQNEDSTGTEIKTPFSNTEPQIVNKNYSIFVSGEFQYSLFDLKGILISKGSGKNSVNISPSVKTGMYILRVKQINQISQKKILLE